MTFGVVDRKILGPEPVPTLPTLAPGSDPDAKGGIRWERSIAAHLVRASNQRPARRIPPLYDQFHNAVVAFNKELDIHGLCLLPGGIHPWLDPRTEIHPTVDDPLFPVLDKVVPLRTHGIGNGHDVRLSIAFNGDPDLARLFAAVRILLPIIPAISAGSPWSMGREPGTMSQRVGSWVDLTFPGATKPGALVPEGVYTEDDHIRTIEAPMAQELARRNALAVLGNEWTDPRGAVVQFTPGWVHIRLVDTQESVAASLAVCEMIVAVLRALVKGRWVSTYLQRAWHEQDLTSLLHTVIQQADAAVIMDRNYPMMFGLLDQDGITAGKLWQHLFVDLYADLSETAQLHMAHILEHGCLARRILARTGMKPERGTLVRVYGRLADGITAIEPFQ